MINPADIVDNLVDLLRDIPELVELVDGDEERIFAYHDRYPTSTKFEEAKYLLTSPGIMVAWVGTAPASFGPSEVWKHELAMILRSGEESDLTDPPQGYYAMFRLITKGVPTSLGLALGLATVHASCNPMDLPTIRRLPDAAGVDYFEVSLSFTEMGDD